MEKVPSVTATPSGWERFIAQPSGESLAKLSQESPVLLIFLRHFGCTFFCVSLADVARKRTELESMGVRIVFVHMAAKVSIADKFFRKYKLYPIDHIPDPGKQLYLAFGLGRGTPAQLFGLMNWIRGFEAGIVEGHGFAYHNEDIGDGFQMPGVFVLHEGKIKHSFVHQHAWDRPDYEEIVRCCSF